MDLWTTPFLDPASGRSTGGPVMRAAGLGLALSALVVLQLEVLLCILLQILYIYINNLITTITIIYNIVIYVMIHFSQVHLGLDALEGDDWICFFCTCASVLAFVSSEVTKVSRRHWLSPHEGAQINMNYIQR